MAITLDTIGLVVENMARSLAFYRTLGLAIPDGHDDEPNVEFLTPSGVTLGFLSQEIAKTSDSRWQKPIGQSMNLQFRCDSAGEVDEIHAKLISAEYENYQEPWDAFWGQRFARILDPDGNIVNIFADLK